ncbi:hemicentin-1-like isoform X2 [Hypomesus transpacificus]|uniref:hemicentin-1-like isoform X2 n=1 Tax=Hypomesus transpacificus TaxID=137520 RepID=UPI001F07A5C2|nr:hemicentin-1-like isoform X2 [Hypomesus transpacificus]
MRKTFFFVLMIQLGVRVGTTCLYPLEMNPSRLVARHGNSVSVNCSTSVADLEGMGWEASDGGTGLVDDVTWLMWTVESWEDWNGSPKCFINLKNGDQCEETLGVTLYQLPDDVSISPLNHTGPMVEGTEYQLQCDILNVAPVQNLTVTWYKGNETIKTDSYSDQSKTPVNESSILTITPSREDDGALYRCEAQLNLGPEGPQYSNTSSHYPIKVHHGPDIFCSDYGIKEGSSLEGFCSTTGNPSPRTRWLKDGQPMNARAPLSRGQEGVYTLEAEGRTVTRKEVRVSVLYGPEIQCPESYVAAENAPPKLYCEAVGHPPPEITWFRDGEEVTRPESFSRRETGQYVIRATINSASVHHTLAIDIQYPPSEILELEDTEGNIGFILGLKCSSKGNPPPLYTWIHNFSTANNIKEEHVDGVSLLKISDATMENIGNYTCHAENSQGSVTKTVGITLKEPPSVSISLLSHTGPMVEGKKYQMQCDVQNVAPVQKLTVSWYKGNETIKTDSYSDQSKTPVDESSILTITPSREDDGALYRYEPWINTTKLPAKIPVFRGYPEKLVCEAEGYPQPKIKWLYNNMEIHDAIEAGGNLTVTEGGLYNCTATNDVQTTFIVVQVVLKEDYLPLIAGFVAITVVVISVIFVFIYSIYYKNTKMGRYSLKDAKIDNTLKGNVAQNGRGTPLPLTKLS